MKFTYDWLKDYLDTSATPVEVADTLTRIGLEVEDMIQSPAPIAARVVECEKHSDSDHLHVLRVDDGSGTLRQVVCGAPNVRVGLLSALATPGCQIGGMEIKSGKIRGILSDGMMCSGKELGISDDHSGIIELDDSEYKVGDPLTETQVVFDAGITPNRPDYLAVRGVARDLAAAGIGHFTDINPTHVDHVDGSRRVIIENAHACPTYRMVEIHDIKNAPSNPFIADRLSAIGMNPKNAPIDTTNYICYDLAQPMHCFDADQIDGDIIVRNAKDGETFTDLFGNEHLLVETDLVITDNQGILALAGVVGGARGMTTDATKNILLECAYFDPVTVRRTSKRVGVSTDASYRYERGIDPMGSERAMARAVDIITRSCGGKIVGTYTAGRTSVDAVAVGYTPQLFLKKTGIDMNPDEQIKILNSLGFSVNSDGPQWQVTPTTARVDIQYPENIVSELIRLYGYDNIQQDNSMAQVSYQTTVPWVKSALTTRGYFECLNYGFGDLQKEKILSTKENVLILNPIIDTFDTARNSLVQSMLDVIANNDRFRRSNVALFELAAVFDGPNPCQQHDQLIIARTGLYGDKIGIKHGRAASIYDVRADLLALFPNAIVEKDDNPSLWAHPFRAGRLVEKGKIVATFAELHPMVAKKFGIKTNVVLGVVDDVTTLTAPDVWDGHQEQLAPKIALSEFPLITRDFAFLADESVTPDAMTAIAASADPRIIETSVFDVFEMSDGKRSIAFEIVIQPTENMTDEELLSIQTSVITAVEGQLNAKIRDK